MGKTTKTRRRSSHTNSSATVEQHDQLHDESLDGHDQTHQETTFTKMLEMQQQIFQKCLQSFMETTNTRFDNFLIDTTKTIAELKQSLQYTQHEVEDLKTQMSKNQPLNTADVACMKEQLRRVEDNILKINPDVTTYALTAYQKRPTKLGKKLKRWLNSK